MTDKGKLIAAMMSAVAKTLPISPRRAYRKYNGNRNNWIGTVTEHRKYSVTSFQMTMRRRASGKAANELNTTVTSTVVPVSNRLLTSPTEKLPPIQAALKFARVGEPGSHNGFCTISACGSKGLLSTSNSGAREARTTKPSNKRAISAGGECERLIAARSRGSSRHRQQPQ